MISKLATLISKFIFQVKGSSVCPKPFSSSEAGNLNLTAFSRAAAVSEFVDQNVLFCGGRNTDGDVMNDCMIYKTKSDSWDTHSQLLSAREESASAVVAGQVSVKSNFKEIIGFSRLYLFISRCTFLVD